MLSPVEDSLFRDVVGHLASGVTVVTTRVGNEDFGMTASSVTSLSAEPPTMLVCINNRVPTASAVSSAKAYVVNVLTHEQGGIANQFATPSPDKFRGTHTEIGHLGLPLLDNALAYLECQVIEEISGGSHTIFIGQVVRAFANAGSPLTYYRGGYGRFEFSRDEAAYIEAREKILNRWYKPNTLIDLEDFARELKIDSTVAFYALTRLASDGMIKRDVDRGYVVMPFDTRMSDEAFDARCAIELGVIDMTEGLIAKHDIAKLREKISGMAELIENERFLDFTKYVESNVALHEHIVSLAHNTGLNAAYAKLALRSILTQSFGASPKTSERFISIQSDLVNFLAMGNSEGARQAIKKYTSMAKERAREVLEETDSQWRGL